VLSDRTVFLCCADGAALFATGSLALAEDPGVKHHHKHRKMQEWLSPLSDEDREKITRREREHLSKDRCRETFRLSNTAAGADRLPMVGWMRTGWFILREMQG
jgi:hypothetical protein